MHADDIRKELHQILNSHDAALDAIRQANTGMQEAHTAMKRVFEAHDAALVSAIEANRAALRLLNRLMDEGVAGEP
jgi:hypothetical protein